MASKQCEFRAISEHELEQISAGRVCDLGGMRVEFKIPFGSQVLVIWATSGTNDRPGCGGAYYQ
jgi:hypothetical protein